MPALTIEPCTVDDAPTLADVAVKSYLEVYPYLWHDGGQWYLKRCFSQPVLAADLQQPNQAWFLLKEDDNEIVYEAVLIFWLRSEYESSPFVV